jgi:hypothetical protein
MVAPSSLGGQFAQPVGLPKMHAVARDGAAGHACEREAFPLGRPQPGGVAVIIKQGLEVRNESADILVLCVLGSEAGIGEELWMRRKRGRTHGTKSYPRSMAVNDSRSFFCAGPASQILYTAEQPRDGLLGQAVVGRDPAHGVTDLAAHVGIAQLILID